MKHAHLFLFLMCLTTLWGAGADSLAAQNSHEHELVIQGTVRDRDSKRRLENVTVSLVGSSVGTVTNAEGFFALKIPREVKAPQLELSHIGYLNTRFSAQVPEKVDHVTATLWMTPFALPLNEVVVYGGDARRLVEEALRKVPVNYPSTADMLSCFYRETIQKGHRYIGISEAMMDVYKTGYATRRVEADKVELRKARRLLSQKQSDTLAVKVMGGPNLALYLDIVKNADGLLDELTLPFYEFTQEPSILLDDRPQFVISFRPRVRTDFALYKGMLYIDRERLSFTRIVFSLDLSDRDKAVAAILYKKPAGLHFRPQEVSYLITYREQHGVSCLHYLCNEIRFKCDWKRRLFASTYTARSEMVMVEREVNPERVIERRNAFRPREVFYDAVPAYWNEDFWKAYNIIEPTESLENAVKKLRVSPIATSR